MDWLPVADAIAALSGVTVQPRTAKPVAGGSINEAWSIETGDGRLFVKLNAAKRFEMFAAEADGLREIAASDTVRVPDVVCFGTCQGHAFLALEWLDLAAADSETQTRLGCELADMHSRPGDRFGWHRDNTIGSTPQINTPAEDWTAFFGERRLGYQLDLAGRRGATQLYDSGQALLQRLPAFFDKVAIEPRLLHGDLWGGNWAAAGAAPVIFDPAVYYGDPESDIAMTELFGGFGAAFYKAYRQRRPERAGDAARRELYRLYHVLNHFNLFGGGYEGQARRSIAQLLKTG